MVLANEGIPKAKDMRAQQPLIDHHIYLLQESAVTTPVRFCQGIQCNVDGEAWDLHNGLELLWHRR